MTKKKVIQSISQQSRSPSKPQTNHSSQSAPSFDELELIIKSGDSERLRQTINETPSSFDVNNIPNRSSNMSLLMIASELGDLESVKVLIAKHANINKSNNENKTALHYACMSDNTELIEYLIDHYVTINDQVLMDCFIMYILRHTHIDPYPTVLLTLLDHVIYINCVITNNQFQTFIQAACDFGHNDVVNAVLAMGADPRLPHEECPLSVAARQGHIEIVKLLLQFTEKSPLPTDQIKEALISATAAGNLQMVIILRDFAGIAALDILNSALHTTIQYNHINILIYLLEQGANANYIDGHHGYSILKYACIYSRGDKGRFIRVLLDHGANGHEVDEQGDSLLLHTQNNPEAAIVLITYGLDVNQHFANGSTLLLITANSIYNNDIYMLTCLVQHGADVNISHKYTGYTSIMYAIKCQCYNGVKLLLEHRADLTLPNNEGEDSIHILNIYTDKSNVDSMNISTICYEYLKINKNINTEKAILK